MSFAGVTVFSSSIKRPFAPKALLGDQHAKRTDDTDTVGGNKRGTALACLPEELKGCPIPALDVTSLLSLVFGVLPRALAQGIAWLVLLGDFVPVGKIE